MPDTPAEVESQQPTNDELHAFLGQEAPDEQAAPAEETVEQPPEEPEVQEPDGQGWSGESLLWAQELGMTPEDMESFGDADKFATIADKLYQSVSRQHRPAGDGPQQGYPTNATQQTQRPNEAAWQQGQQPQAQQPYAQAQDIDLSEVDESTAKVFRALQQQVAQQQARNDELVNVMSDMHQLVSRHGQSEELIQTANEWDARFDRLNNEGVFGKGSSLSGSLSDVERQRRWLVAHAVRAEREVMGQNGDALPPIDIHTFRKAKQLFGDVINGAVRKAAEESKKVASHATPSGSPAAVSKNGRQTDRDVIQAWRRRYNK